LVRRCPVASLVHLGVEGANSTIAALRAEVIATDGPFGNLVTNLDAEDFLQLGYPLGQEVPVKIAGKEMRIKFVRTFSGCGPGAASSIYRLAWPFCLGREPGKFFRRLWREAASRIIHPARWEVIPAEVSSPDEVSSRAKRGTLVFLPAPHPRRPRANTGITSQRADLSGAQHPRAAAPRSSTARALLVSITSWCESDCRESPQPCWSRRRWRAL